MPCIACGYSEYDLGRNSKNVQKYINLEPNISVLTCREYEVGEYSLLCDECRRIMHSSRGAQISEIYRQEIAVIQEQRAINQQRKDAAHLARIGAFQQRQQHIRPMVPIDLVPHTSFVPGPSSAPRVPPYTPIPASRAASMAGIGAVLPPRPPEAHSSSRNSLLQRMFASHSSRSDTVASIGSRGTSGEHGNPDTCPICIEVLHSRDDGAAILSCCRARVHLSCVASLRRPDGSLRCPLCRNERAQLQQRAPLH